MKATVNATTKMKAHVNSTTNKNATLNDKRELKVNVDAQVQNESKRKR